jgi:DnaJ-class molecular chaperone
MGEQVSVNTLCPLCEGAGEIRIGRAIAVMQGETSTGPARTAWVAEQCKPCNGNGKLKGLQTPS